MTRLAWTLVVLAGLVGGCDAPTSTDGGPRDASVDADRLRRDANLPRDAGVEDAGADAESDAGAPHDASAADAGAPIDSGTARDGGGGDAGESTDGGMDGGIDAGLDGGVDAGFDGGMDAGPDAGLDAGSDSASDAGSDSGPPMACNAACVSPLGETCWSCGVFAPPGSPVTIPASTSYLLDVDAEVDVLTIRGSLRVIGDRPVELRANGIDVESGGAFSAGTAGSPHLAPLRIVMTGDDRLIDIEGGDFTIVAPRPTAVIVPLAGVEEAGDAALTLAQAVDDWQLGDEVLVTPTGYFDTSTSFVFEAGAPPRGRTERFVLGAVGGASVTVSTALLTRREGLIEAGQTVDARARVAHLTRSVTIEGADDADWAAGHGVRIHARSVGADMTVELSGVRIERAADSGLDEAPVLTRLINFGTFLMEGSVVLDSRSRGFVAEGSGGVTLRDNVFAHIEGHGIWLRHGMERGDTIERNLVADVRLASSSLPSSGSEVQADRSIGRAGPSAFMIENPDNTIRDNYAADVEGSGYWLAFGAELRGIWTGLDYAPYRQPMGVFEGNTAQAIDFVGVQLNPGIVQVPMGFVADTNFYEPQDDTTASGPKDRGSTHRAILANTTVAGARRSAFRTRSARTTLSAPRTWSTSLVGYFAEAPTTIEDGAFVGRFGPSAALAHRSIVALGSAAVSTWTDNHFANYPADPTTETGGVLGLSNIGLFGLDRSLSNMSGNTYFGVVDLGVRRLAPWTRNDIVGPVLDAAGLGGFPGRWWVEDVPYYTEGNTCVANATDGGSSGLLCTTSGYLSLIETSVTTASGPVDRPEITLRRSPTAAIGYPIPAAMLDRRERSLAIPRGEIVTLSFPAYAAPPRGIEFTVWAPPGDGTIVRIHYPTSAVIQSVTVQDEFGIFGATTLAQSSSFAAMQATPMSWYFDGTDGSLYFHIVGDFQGQMSFPPMPFLAQRAVIFATAPGSALP